MSAFRHLRPSDYKIVPWKNGGGSTTELLVEPRDASLATGFNWRVSLAALDGPGPFSGFPGVDRIIMQLEGQPMSLDHGKDGRHQLTLCVPYRFRGEWTTFGHLDGRARDLNVMTTRTRASAHVEFTQLPVGETLPSRRTAGPFVVHVLAGALRLPDAVTATAGDTLVFDHPLAATPALSATQATTLALVMVRSV